MKSLQHVLFISYDGMTDPLGQSQVIPYLAGLKKHGYHITILSCEKIAVYKTRKPPIAELLQRLDISWVPLMYTKNPPVVSTLFDIIKLRRAARKIHLHNPVNLVHTRPGVPALVGLWMKNKFGIKFLNDIREFYADSRIDGGMWKQDRWIYRQIYRYFKKQEDEQVAKSDGIVCLTHAAEKIIKSWPGFNKQIPLQVIPCSVDTGLFDPLSISPGEKTTLRSELGIPAGNRIFTYLGSIGGWYLTDEMLRLCKILSDVIPESSFLFISPHLHSTILAAATTHGLPAEKLITRQANRTEIPLLLSLSHYSLFFIKPCYSKLSSSPTKHAELMAMGLPVITNSGVGDVEQIVNEYHGGYVLNEFTDQAFAIIAADIAGNRTSFDAEAIRRGAIEFYSLEKAVKKYIDIYKAILK